MLYLWEERDHRFLEQGQYGSLSERAGATEGQR